LLKLIAINNYYYYRGGAESVFFGHNRLFRDEGWGVIPFSMKHPKNLYSEWSDYFVDEIEYGAQYSLWDSLKRVPKVIYSAEARERIIQLINIVRPNICHAHNIYHHISPSILGAIKEKNIPLVLTLHDLKIACPAYNMLSRNGICERCKGGKVFNVLLNRCIKNSVALSSIVLVESLLHNFLSTFDKYVDKFVVPSEFYISKLVEWGWDREKFIHIPNFINADNYTPSYKPGKSYLYFGRLSREKGLETLIRAASLVKAKLMIVGTGSDELPLRALAKSLRGDVEFLGHLTGERLISVIQSARAVILPSEWYENAPMSIIESYAAGKMVIGANIGGIPELIRDGETGFMFESGSINDLVSILERSNLLSDDQLLEMGRNSRELVISRYSEKVYLGRMMGLYGELGALGS
jgi:glycosyltransferase involved in cell wall biosynthesis